MHTVSPPWRVIVLVPFLKGLALLTQAAHAGHPVGLVRLGSCYDTGEGVETDIAKANGYFQVTTVVQPPGKGGPVLRGGTKHFGSF